MNLQRVPSGPLRLFVKLLWFSDSPARPDGAGRERVLPTGGMHVVLRLTRDPLRVYRDAHDTDGDLVGTSVIGGARAGFYVRDVSRPSCSVGALLRPGGALPLLGAPADAFAERHTDLEQVWGREVDGMAERLLALSDPHERLAAFEALLQSRVPRVRALHPAVAHAIARFDEGAWDVGATIRESGYSHRHFVTLFREAAGLTPKRYCRVLRLQHVIGRLQRGLGPAEVALESGFADQAHLTRELRALSGVTPGQWVRLAPRHTHHVPIETTSDSFKTRERRRFRLRP